jgi:hypothetical protein
MKILGKLNPQPDEHGIFATGFTRKENLDENNREILDSDWDLKNFGESVAGVWLCDPETDELFGKVIKQGRFSPCPIDVSVEELFGNQVKPVKIDGEWFWIDYRNF